MNPEVIRVQPDLNGLLNYAVYGACRSHQLTVI
jgi:hypothetical protein